jgi:hypothetical protein
MMEAIMTDIYQGDFENWKSVQEKFATDFAEPAKVLFAGYFYESYEGDADVAWLDGHGNVGYVSGGHCSCYGLEGQFDPEFYSPETARDMIERNGYTFGKAREAIMDAVA